MIETAVKTLGAKRVVFGFDAPIRHFSGQLSNVLATDLPETVKQDILWNNTVRLLPKWSR